MLAPGSLFISDSNHVKQRAIDFIDTSGVFRDVAGENWESFSNWNDGQETRRIFTVQTTKNYFAALGIPVALDRGWTVSDWDQVVILSYGFWQKYFHSDPSVIGRSINLEGRAFTVIGVLLASLRTLIGYGFSPDIYVPSYRPDTTFRERRVFHNRLIPRHPVDEPRQNNRCLHFGDGPLSKRQLRKSPGWPSLLLTHGAGRLGSSGAVYERSHRCLNRARRHRRGTAFKRCSLFKLAAVS